MSQRKEFILRILFSNFFLILVILSSCSVTIAEQELDWKIEQKGFVNPINVDSNNNFLLYHSDPSGNESITWIVKYSNSSDIQLNKSINVYYSYFNWAGKVLDSEGKLYLFGFHDDDIYIDIYNSYFEFERLVIVETSEDFPSLIISDIYVTEVGSIYFHYTDEYIFLNETHAQRTDGLYKVDSNGKIRWNLSFECVAKRNTRADFRLSEKREGTAYLSHYNTLYKINTNRGKIKWQRELSNPITGLTSIFEDVCVTYVDSSQYSPMSIEYITSTNEKKWNKAVQSQIGFWSVERIESKTDKIGLHIVDFNTSGNVGDANETYIVFNSEGELVVDESNYYTVFWFYNKFYYLTYSNSYYSLYHGSLNATTEISKYDYDAPPYIPKKVNGFDFITISVILPVLFVAKKLARRNKRVSKKEIF